MTNKFDPEIAVLKLLTMRIKNWLTVNKLGKEI